MQSNDIFARRASLDDLHKIVALHRHNVDKREFSSLLPSIFLEHFYRVCLLHPKSMIMLLVSEKQVFGISMVWFDHLDITKKYIRKVSILLAFYLAWLVLKLDIARCFTIISYIFESNKPVLPNNIQPFCVAMAILDEAHRNNPSLILKFFEMFSSNVEELKKKSAGGIWASASHFNYRSIRMIRKILKPHCEGLLRNTPQETRYFVWSKK
jgi:hypothetical protein